MTSSDYNGLYRSSDNRIIAGVCGGLAHKWRLNASGLRLIVLILSLMSGVGVIIYVALWLLLNSLPTKSL